MLASSEMRSYLKLHFLVLIWGFTAIVGLLVTINPIALVFYRTFIAAIGLGIIIWYKKDKSFYVSSHDVFKVCTVGLILSLHWILFFLSARISTASVCLAGIATTSLWTSLIEPIVKKKPIRPLEVGLGILAFSGLYMVLKFEFNHALGLTLALLSAILAAIFTVSNSKLVQRIDAHTITFYEMASASFFSLLFLFAARMFHFLDEGPMIPQGNDWIWILFLALICTVYASTNATQLMRQFSAYLINLTVNLEPVYGIGLAFFIFGEKERMTEGFYWGTLIIILAVGLYPILNAIPFFKKQNQ
jgi:drug/metabolite transporter (DMT)-like permease